MLSSFDYPSLMHNADFVGIPDGGQTMRDGDGGPGRGKSVESFLDNLLGLGVESRCSLIENEYRRILQNGAGNADPLSLTSGKLASAIAYVGLVAFFLFAPSTPKAMLLNMVSLNRMAS